MHPLNRAKQLPSCIHVPGSSPRKSSRGVKPEKKDRVRKNDRSKDMFNLLSGTSHLGGFILEAMLSKAAFNFFCAGFINSLGG